MGQIEGGWGYVIAAYLATWMFVGGYAVSLFIRRREQNS
jgi:CcmD family protein